MNASCVADIIRLRTFKDLKAQGTLSNYICSIHTFVLHTIDPKISHHNV